MCSISYKTWNQLKTSTNRCGRDGISHLRTLTQGNSDDQLFVFFSGDLLVSEVSKKRAASLKVGM